MHPFLKAALFCLAPVAANGVNTPFFSEYIEGSSNNKAVELYNPTTDTLHLGTQQFVIQIYANGATTPTSTIALSGTLAPGKTFVVTHTSFSLPVPAGTVQQTSGSINFNGDDAVVLRSGGGNGLILDAIGQIGFRPTLPAAWVNADVSTLDRTLLRKPGTMSGDPNGNDVFDPSVSFTALAVDNVSNLGVYQSQPGPSLTTSIAQLSFGALQIGHSSEVKWYTVQTANTLGTLSVIASTGFQVALSSSGPFNDSISISEPQLTASDTIYSRFVPTASGLQSGSIRHTIGDLSITISVTGSIAGEVTRIGIVQGSGQISAFVGKKVVVQGVVTADLQTANQQKGFYLQDSTDQNPLSSDGLFVYDNLSAFEVNKGDVVRVEGEVSENFNQTQLINITSVSLLNIPFDLQPAVITFPLDSVNSLEKYEGMLVTVPQKMVVTETYNLGRYGELLLSVNDRLYQPTEVIDLNDADVESTSFEGTSNSAAVAARQFLNDRSKLLLCDRFSIQNPNPIPFIDPMTKTIRSGSSVSDLTGVLGYDFSAYRLYPDAEPAFQYAPRPIAPVINGANVLVTGMNVLNYFNGNGQGGGFPTSRGAGTFSDFKRQRSKIVSVIKSVDADVYGLMEMENDAASVYPALNDLVDSLNAAYQSQVFAFVHEPLSDTNGHAGTDEIKVAIIYKQEKVMPEGAAKYCNDASFTSLGRPPLAQTFRHLASGQKFTVIANHFKSKSCTGATGLNTDQNDGQACFNAQRKLQAAALLTFIEKMKVIAGDSDILTLGDYNAYSQEDPMDLLRFHGLTDVTEGLYSYIFSGQTGSLDHALVTESLKKQLAGATKWHNNADEPTVIDYTSAFKTQDLFEPVPYRSSDHDPVVVGLNLQVNNTGISDQLINQKESYYPNPVTAGTVYSEKLISGEIQDLTGQLMLQFADQNRLNVSMLPPGVYVLKVNNRPSVKLIIR